MNLAILSRSPRSYSTRRLRAAGIKRGHAVRVLDTVQLGLFLDDRGPWLTHRAGPLDLPQAVIPRVGSSVTLYGTAVVRQFEQAGVFCLNTSQAILQSRDKLRAMQLLARHGIGIPSTAFVHEKDDVLAAIERVGGVPVIIKLLEGTQGVGVILAESTRVARAIIETLQGARQQVLIQKFVAESKGQDLRALVVGGQVVAAMRRTAHADDFRANVHRGGRAEGIELDEAQERMAVRSARLLGLHVAGVDMLESADGPRVLEVNSSPGFEGIERASGVDVADAVIAYLEEQLLFPEVDITERLQLGSGWHVVELTVHDMPLVENRTLAEAHLEDVRVLSIRRAGVQIANPGGGTRILPGDVLLCYGSRMALTQLIPRRPVTDAS